MNIDEFIKLLSVINSLLEVIIWPLLLFFVLLKFFPSLKALLSNVAEFSIKGGGLEVMAKREQVEAAVALTKASLNQGEIDIEEITDTISNVVSEKSMKHAHDATVLWVDDHPDNNIYERRSLEAMGISFTLAVSTEAALDKIAQRHFDIVISDMSRPSDERAGYTLLSALRTMNNTTPFIIYSGSNALEHKIEARKKGAIGSTSRATELFSYVTSAINRHNNEN